MRTSAAVAVSAAMHTCPSLAMHTPTTQVPLPSMPPATHTPLPRMPPPATHTPYEQNHRQV